MGLTMNQAGVIANRYQDMDQYPRVVTICSAGCLRSPTAAVVLAGEPFNKNTRCAGLTDEYAIIPLSPSLMAWADEFVVMEQKMYQAVHERYKKAFGRDLDTTIVPVTNLDIPDNFQYRDPELMTMIAERYTERSPK